MTLAQLNIGEIGVVETVITDGILRRRMLDLGLIPGTKVKAEFKSSSGHLVAYAIRGAIVALRLETAQKVMLRKPR